MKLHEAVDPNGEGLSLLHYQFSTLQFILGQLEDAQKLAQRSYELTVQHTKADSDQANQHVIMYSIAQQELALWTLLDTLASSNLRSDPDGISVLCEFSF